MTEIVELINDIVNILFNIARISNELFIYRPQRFSYYCTLHLYI